MLPMELSREKEVPGRCELPVSSDRDMCHWHNLWSARKCQREIPCGSAVLPWKSPWAPPPDPCGSHCSHHGVSVRLGFQGEIRHWRSYFTYLPTFLVWHFSICSVSLKVEWFLVDFVPLPAFGYIWNTLVLLLSPDLALESLIHLSECRHTIVVGLDVHTSATCPSKHPFVLDYFIILKIHSISGTGVRLRNLNTFCNSIIGRHWNKSPPEVG